MFTDIPNLFIRVKFNILVLGSR